MVQDLSARSVVGGKTTSESYAQRHHDEEKTVVYLCGLDAENWRRQTRKTFFSEIGRRERQQQSEATETHSSVAMGVRRHANDDGNSVAFALSLSLAPPRRLCIRLVTRSAHLI